MENNLSVVPVQEWTTRQAIVVDWHDGPREGLCALSHPEIEFKFELLDERPNPDGLDDRLFRLRQVPAGTVAKVLTLLSELGQPEGAVWVPIWKFASPVIQREAKQFLDGINAKACPPFAIIASRDMEHFDGCWPMEKSNGDVIDWFSALAIPTTPCI